MITGPAQIVQSLARLQCTKCGAEANATCNCGEPYKPVEIAKDYVRKNPTASVREVAAQTGVSHASAQRAKSRVSPDTPVTGRDGKTYPKKIHWQKRVHPEVVYEAHQRGVTATSLVRETTKVESVEHGALCPCSTCVERHGDLTITAEQRRRFDAQPLVCFRLACEFWLPKLNPEDLELALDYAQSFAKVAS
jgi:hypothetical protein